MGFHQDAKIIEEIVQRRDPAFVSVHAGQQKEALRGLSASARDADKDAFLLAAMGVVAMAGNGHSRVIPNLAIDVVPHRIVMRDADPVMVVDGAAVPIISVNGSVPGPLFEAWRHLLAGSDTRQRMLSGIMMAWPAALRVAGVEGVTLHYALADGRNITCASDDRVEAASLYPVSDNGFLDPNHDDYALASGSMVQWQDGIWRIRIAGLKDVNSAEFLELAQRIQTRRDAGLVVDLRGNTGGDYTKARPLIDWLAKDWRGMHCAILVNGYTFSAAIVVAVLLVHRLGARVQLFGSDVGDTLAFYAEGDTAPLHQSGGLLRYASGWHDWQSGQADATTPQIIARDLVGIEALDIVSVPEASQLPTAMAFAQGH
ncbi:S41 family peptidase [Tateyamaria pelophila]|uniref:hypothetical protein n=1 Tax=Tateyamaria pelophila TaxID=328415 RepID=UPI001CC10DFA|nr:hypothetical protein [Tateyamaria pelophila]